MRLAQHIDLNTRGGPGPWERDVCFATFGDRDVSEELQGRIYACREVNIPSRGVTRIVGINRQNLEECRKNKETSL